MKVKKSQKLQIDSLMISKKLLQICEKCNYPSGEDGKCIETKYQKKLKEINDMLMHFNDRFFSLYFYNFMSNQFQSR